MKLGRRAKTRGLLDLDPIDWSRRARPETAVPTEGLPRTRRRELIGLIALINKATLESEATGKAVLGYVGVSPREADSILAKIGGLGSLMLGVADELRDTRVVGWDVAAADEAAREAERRAPIEGGDGVILEVLMADAVANSDGTLSRVAAPERTRLVGVHSPESLQRHLLELGYIAIDGGLDDPMLPSAS